MYLEVKAILFKSEIQIYWIMVRIFKLHILDVNNFDIDIIWNKKPINQSRVGFALFIGFI